METDWEGMYQIGKKPWDKGSPAPPLLDWMGKNPELLSGRILVPGCGLGHDARAITTALPDVDLLAVDISETALKEANAFPVSGGETYRELDLFDLPGPLHGAFDWIWEHTCFCAINPERRDEYVEAVHGALKDEAELLAIFYLNPYDNEHHSGSGPPHGTSIEELETRFMESGRFSVVEKYIPKVSYPGREGLELMMRLKKC